MGMTGPDPTPPGDAGAGPAMDWPVPVGTAMPPPYAPRGPMPVGMHAMPPPMGRGSGPASPPYGIESTPSTFGGLKVDRMGPGPVPPMMPPWAPACDPYAGMAPMRGQIPPPQPYAMVPGAGHQLQVPIMGHRAYADDFQAPQEHHLPLTARSWDPDEVPVESWVQP